ncbi:MAG: arylsulfatase [Candidatus Hydrogenedentes bacterium]|nr:arylsulfatase [Candidatus Hydrogenedentota bacterium]
MVSVPLTRRAFLRAGALAIGAAGGLNARVSAATTKAERSGGAKPNIIFILADDLGYGDLGCYGQKVIQTPNLDRMAAEGVRFTQCYAGSTVCAPSRCCLMTGMHTGHATIRGNANVPLRPGDVTVAETLKSAGYATGLVGKWGLGEPDTTGIPNRKGFDEFFGYLNQGHAHNYYPDYLWRNETKVPLAGNVVSKGVASARAQYAPDLFTAEALDFIRRHQSHPFFLYLAYTSPHANNERGKAEGNGMEVPSDAPYTDRPWSQIEKNHAAMITRLDRDAGSVLAALKELGLDDSTLVFFSSDNGPHKEGGADPTFFHSSGPFRGIKRDLYEGGIRVPMIARWPGRVRPGAVSDDTWAFWDVLPTIAEIAGTEAPAGLDGVSAAPLLLKAGGAGVRRPRQAVQYWEFHERGFQQAARKGRWKAVRTKLGAPLELYDLKRDPGESRDVSRQHARVVREFETFLKSARTGSEHWPVR